VRNIVVLILISVFGLLVNIPAFSASIFSVIGTVKNADGTLAASGLTVVVENETRNLTSEDTLGKQEQGKYGVVFVDTGNKIVAAKGDSLNITVKDVEKTVASVTYQLTDDDIAKGRAIVDISFASITPANQTSIFTVAGTIRNADDILAVAGLQVVVTNETKGLIVTTESGKQEPGKYGAVFVNTENEAVATQGDAIKVTVKEPSVTYHVTYQLTADDISKGRAIVGVKLGSVSPGNQPPVASFSFSPEDVYVNVEIRFDASFAHDTDGQIISYEWDFGDGSTGIGQLMTHSYLSEGQYTVVLKVTDNDGESTTKTSLITIGSVPVVHTVTAVIDMIQPNPAYQGSLVEFKGRGTDSQGHDITTYEWRSNIDGAIGSSVAFTKSDLSAGEHVIYLRVKCSQGEWSPEVNSELTVMSKGEFDPELAVFIDEYLSGKNSPMVGAGIHYAKWGAYFSIDPLFVVAMSGAESSFGVNPCGNQYNAWGWKYGGNCWGGFEPGWDLDANQDEFQDAPGFASGTGIYMETGYEDGIFWVTHNLRKYYFDLGLDTIEEVGRKWCTEGTEDWIRNVTQFLEEMTTGTSPEPRIQVSASSHNFERVPVEISIDWKLIISNIGGAFLTVNSITSSDPAFITTLPNFPQSISPNNNIEVTVRFSPSSEGPYSGIVTVVSNDPNEPEVYVSVEGIGQSQADYRLPYPEGVRYMVQQGNNSQTSHQAGTEAQYAWDFGGTSGGASIGDPVVAARSGRVLMVEEGFPDTGRDDPALANSANYVVIDHEDGTYALYLHLQRNSVPVSLGQYVEQGQHIGNVGLSGWTTGPHLHFQVQNSGASWYQQSIPISFSDPDVARDSGIPQTGEWYSSANAGFEPSVISANIGSYSPSDPGDSVEVVVGSPITLTVTFTNTGNTAWRFISGASVLDSSGTFVADYEKTLDTALQPGGQTTVSWTHTVDKAGNYWLQFAVWKAKPFIAENLLSKKPSPSQKLIIGVKPAIQADAIIFGKVTDASSGKPVKGAKVSANGSSCTTDAGGSYLLSITPGPCSIAASASGYYFEADNILLSDGQTHAMDFALKPRVGCAIVVAGEGNWLEAKMLNMKADYAYKALRSLGFGEDDILYLNANKKDSDVDGAASKAAFIEALTEQAPSRVGQSSPLVLYLVGHGAQDELFKLNGDEIFVGWELKEWLKAISEETTVIVVIESCYSGSFITNQANSISLNDRKRIIVTSCRDDETTDFLKSDFCRFFWKHLSMQQGRDLRLAFIRACEWHFETGEPQFDDNGDGISHSAEDVAGTPASSEGDEGWLAANMTIGEPGGPGEVLERLIWASLSSPGELRVHDSQGRVTGLVDGIVKEEIPDSVYAGESETVVIWPANDTYRYEVTGTDTGIYGLIVVSGDEELEALTATDIPTTSGAVHQYTVDWDAVSRGEVGVTISVDSDGDGSPDGTIATDKEFTKDEYLSAIAVNPEEKLSTTWADVKRTRLLQNYPNPFNPDTWIPYTLAEENHVTVNIYAATGQFVRTLNLGKKPAGLYLSKDKAAHWDGRDENGESVSSGVYFYTLGAGGFRTTRKMVAAE
jgi:murein DD-endopeptidase MepM/ murein hydrolase activator NlpD/chitodextrinase